MRTGTGWCAHVRERTTVQEVARALALTPARGGSWGPCPACGAERRGRQDRRAPLGVKDRLGWRCHRCQAGGDLLDLAALELAGARLRELPREDKARIRAWCAARGWCDPPGPDPATGRPYRTPKPRTRPRTPEDRSTEPGNPPLNREELAELWSRARRVTLEERVGAWLWRRGVNPVLVASMDLARALARGTPSPSWAAYGREPWADTRPCLIPLYLPSEAAERGAAAEPAGVVARWVGEARPSGGVKQQPPQGHSQPGRVYASPLARRAAAGQAEPRWAWVVEGGPDFLALTVHEEPAAVVGGDPSVAGSWAAVAELLELGGLAGAGVVVATDPGEAGDRFALAVCQALPAGREVRRWSPPEEHPDDDVSDHLARLARRLPEGWPGEDLCSDLAEQAEL